MLLILLTGLVALRIAQAHRQHTELTDLLNDLATMLGELFTKE
jgi:hypothetical protein